MPHQCVCCLILEGPLLHSLELIVVSVYSTQRLLHKLSAHNRSGASHLHFYLQQMAEIYREAMRKQAEEDEAQRRGPGDGDRQ